MIGTSITDAERLRGWTARHLGLHFEDDKLKFLAAVVKERAVQGAVSAGAYLDSITGAPAEEEWRQLVTALTVPETFFFRHVDQFEAFTGAALPEAFKAAGAQGQVRILCAGCASGEEPYSLVMWMREHGVDTARIAPIHAVDLNPAMLQKAAAARYSPWALRNTPVETRSRWFAKEGQDFALADSIRSAVRFEQLNLAESIPEWWAGKKFDVIFCRNVLMYFTREAAADAIARLADALVPGGYLFMGHAETLRDRSDAFELCHSHDAFYYRRRGQGVAAWAASARPVEVADTQGANVALSAAAAPSAAPALLHESPPEIIQVPAQRLENAWRLLAEERFADALRELESLPDTPDVEENLELRAMRAALLSHAGMSQEAEWECESLLILDPQNAGAHYLIALCRDAAYDRRAAVEHDLQAIALAPRFALPRLHLGLMARRAGDVEEATRYFDEARELLETEDNDRLLLFGGGFSRAALMSLCGERRAPGRLRRVR